MAEVSVNVITMDGERLLKNEILPPATCLNDIIARVALATGHSVRLLARGQFVDKNASLGDFEQEEPGVLMFNATIFSWGAFDREMAKVEDMRFEKVGGSITRQSMAVAATPMIDGVHKWICRVDMVKAVCEGHENERTTMLGVTTDGSPMVDKAPGHPSQEGYFAWYNLTVGPDAHAHGECTVKRPNESYQDLAVSNPTCIGDATIVVWLDCGSGCVGFSEEGGDNGDLGTISGLPAAPLYFFCNLCCKATNVEVVSCETIA